MPPALEVVSMFLIREMCCCDSCEMYGDCDLDMYYCEMHCDLELVNLVILNLL